jgi:hypothetical protein
MLAGAGFPPRRAVRVDGGYRVTGQQPFASGAHQARWFMGIAHVFDGDKPRLQENGEPVALLTACPRKDGLILDTWHTLGMRGTGSHDVVMMDVFVPDLHAPFLVPWEKPGSAYQGPLYNLTIYVSLVCVRSHHHFQLSPPAITGLIGWVIPDRVMFADFACDLVHHFAALFRIGWKVRVRSCDFGQLLEFLPCLATGTRFSWIANHAAIYAYRINNGIVIVNVRSSS